MLEFRRGPDGRLNLLVVLEYGAEEETGTSGGTNAYKWNRSKAIARHTADIGVLLVCARN